MIICFEKTDKFLGTEKAIIRVLNAMLHKWMFVKAGKVQAERTVNLMGILQGERC